MISEEELGKTSKLSPQQTADTTARSAAEASGALRAWQATDVHTNGGKPEEIDFSASEVYLKQVSKDINNRRHFIRFVYLIFGHFLFSSFARCINIFGVI